MNPRTRAASSVCPGVEPWMGVRWTQSRTASRSDGPSARRAFTRANAGDSEPSASLSAFLYEPSWPSGIRSSSESPMRISSSRICADWKPLAPVSLSRNDR